MSFRSPGKLAGHREPVDHDRARLGHPHHAASRTDLLNVPEASRRRRPGSRLQGAKGRKVHADVGDHAGHDELPAAVFVIAATKSSLSQALIWPVVG